MRNENDDIKRVLIAEDDEDMRSMLAFALESSGALVETAASGEALLQRVKALCLAGRLPDLIVSDVVMPGMNGLDALALIQRIAPTVPFVLITAFGSRRTHEHARALGARAVFDKPFDLRQFNQYVIQLLRGEQAAPPQPQRRLIC